MLRSVLEEKETVNCEEFQDETHNLKTNDDNPQN
jgi:hypothetical protein